MWRFLLRGANVPPKQVPSRNYILQSLRGCVQSFSPPKDDCDWFKEMQTTHGVFFSFPRMHLWCSQTFLHSAVEKGQAMRN